MYEFRVRIRLQLGL